MLLRCKHTSNTASSLKWLIKKPQSLPGQTYRITHLKPSLLSRLSTFEQMDVHPHSRILEYLTMFHNAPASVTLLSYTKSDLSQYEHTCNVRSSSDTILRVLPLREACRVMTWIFQLCLPICVMFSLARSVGTFNVI